MEVLLIRRYAPQGTNGELLIHGARVCYTIELPWRQNARRISCIPEGCYALRLRYSVRYGEHLEVTGVPGRSAILIHAANDALKELQGCIAPVTELTGAGKGQASRQALERLKAHVCPLLKQGTPVCLTIKTPSS